MNLSDKDQQFIWHPLTQHQTSEPPIPIVRALGSKLWDEEGNAYIDGIASWYTAMYGHCNPALVKAATQQLNTLDQVVFTGFTHQPAIDLAESLLNILPSNQTKVFFNDNGSTAVEAGIKMALQFHFNKGDHRDTIIALEEGFHGDTFAAMSASGLSAYNGPFENFFLKVKRIPAPTAKNCDEVIKALQTFISENKCAAFIYEPLVQGAAGMKFHEAEALETVLKVCHENKIVTIADEVMTGFGKTGTHFASSQLNTYPDIICLSKALTAGVVPMSITSCTQDIFDAFLGNTAQKAFFHAHTYSANPLGCAVAKKAIDLLLSEEIQRRIKSIEERHGAFCRRLEKHPKISEVRTKGVILALELNITTERYGNLRNKLYQFFLRKGVFLRPLGNIIYVLPPFVIEKEELQKIYDSIEEALRIV